MKLLFPVVLMTALSYFSQGAIAAPICGEWNNYENCVGGTNPPRPNGIDQGTISKQHYDNVVNHVKPNFEKYRDEHSRSNRSIQSSFDDKMNKIDDYFKKYAKGVNAWKNNSPGSFYDYFNNNDVNQVLNTQWNKFREIVTNTYQDTYNKYVDLYVKLNKKTVERIEYHYWAKAYAPTISGKWGFQPEYSYKYSYNVLDGLNFISEGGSDKYYTALTFNDKWNSAATQPTTKTLERTVYVQMNQTDFNNRIDRIRNDFINTDTDNTTPYESQIAYIMEFESKLLQVLTLDSLDDKKTKHILYNMAYVDTISREDILKDIFYSTQNYAESNAISLVYAYATNRQDQEYLSRLKNKLEKVKQLSWYQEANALYKQIIEGILEGNDLPISIVLDYRYINYVIDSNKMERRGWSGYINKGDMRAYVNPYSSDQLEVMRAKESKDFASGNLYYPTNQTSNDHWEFIGVIFDKPHYQSFIQSVTLSQWGTNTFPGDIHKSDGRYFTPKFNGNPLNGNKQYPGESTSNEYWLYLGNEDKPDEGMYSYIVYARFYHDLYSQMMKLWSYNIQNNNTNYVEIDTIYQQSGKINNTLFTLFNKSEKAWRYAAYTLLDSSLLQNVNTDIEMQEQLVEDLGRMVASKFEYLDNIPEIDLFPTYEEILDKWANGEWDPPEEFTAEWYPRALDMFYNHDELRVFIRDSFRLELNEEDLAEIQELIAVFSNTNLVSLINAMGITSSLTIATETVTPIATLATIFGIFL